MFAARLAYFRKLVRQFEIGATGNYFLQVHTSVPVHAFFIAAGARPYVPFEAGDEVEIGFPIHIGVEAMSISGVPGTWVGTVSTVGLDARVWAGANFAVTLGVDTILFSQGHNGSDPEQHGFYFRTDGNLSTLSAWIGCLAAF